MQRVVTGHDSGGRSVFVATGAAPRTFDFGEGSVSGAYYWGTQGVPNVPAGEDDPALTMPSVFPEPGETTFIVGQFPAHSQGGMHATDTVDYVTILSGEVWLLLDGGEEVHLTAGDSVIQNGTNHAWHNRRPEPCVFVVVLVGASRRS